MEPTVFRTVQWGVDDWFVYRGSKDDRCTVICECTGANAEQHAKRIARLLELASAWNDEAIMTRADVVIRETT